MLHYETINIWDTINRVIVEWIESVVKEGWNIWRGKERLEEIAETITKKILKSLNQDLGVSEFHILRLIDLFNPVIYTWIDNILLIKSDYIRNPQKLNNYAVIITSDLVKLFLKEEDFVEFI